MMMVSHKVCKHDDDDDDESGFTPANMMPMMIVRVWRFHHRGSEAQKG